LPRLASGRETTALNRETSIGLLLRTCWLNCPLEVLALSVREC